MTTDKVWWIVLQVTTVERTDATGKVVSVRHFVELFDSYAKALEAAEGDTSLVTAYSER